MMNHLQNKYVLVLGLGETGLSALRWLSAQGARVAIADTRDHPPNKELVEAEFPDINLFLGALDEETLKKRIYWLLVQGLRYQSRRFKQPY